jgi:hypothetical protein
MDFNGQKVGGLWRAVAACGTIILDLKKKCWNQVILQILIDLHRFSMYFMRFHGFQGSEGWRPVVACANGTMPL